MVSGWAGAPAGRTHREPGGGRGPPRGPGSPRQPGQLVQPRQPAGGQAVETVTRLSRTAVGESAMSLTTRSDGASVTSPKMV